MIGARGLTAILTLAVCLGGCTRDGTLGLFGFARKPAVARTAEPPKPSAVPVAAPEEEPVPLAAPRPPVEAEPVAPPPGGRARRPS